VSKGTRSPQAGGQPGTQSSGDSGGGTSAAPYLRVAPLPELALLRTGRAWKEEGLLLEPGAPPRWVPSVWCKRSRGNSGFGSWVHQMQV
jgi:hypothetical protein